MSTVAQIYDAMWHGSHPALLPGRWSRFACHPSFRMLPAANRQEILRMFPAKKLGAAGFLRQQGGDWQISPALKPTQEGETDATCLLFVRRAGDDAPYQVIASHRGLGPHVGALAGLLEDAQFQRLYAAAERDCFRELVVPSNTIDLAILWSMGIPAVPATGLTRIIRDRLPILEQQLLELGDLPYTPILIFSDCYLDQLQRGHSSYLDQVEGHLRGLAQHLGSALRHGWWMPSAERLSQLQYKLANGTENQVREEMRLLVDLDRVRFEQPQPESPKPETNLVEAFGRLAVAGARPDGIDWKESWQNVLLLLRRQLTEPLLAQSEQAGTLDEKARLAAAAATLPMVIGELHLLCANYTNSMSKHAVLPERVLSRLIQLVATVTELTGGKRHGRR